MNMMSVHDKYKDRLNEIVWKGGKLYVSNRWGGGKDELMRIVDSKKHWNIKIRNIIKPPNPTQTRSLKGYNFHLFA